MTVLSILRGIRPAAGILTAPTKSSLAREFTTSVIRNGGHGHHRFEIMPSKWGWTKYKDMFHFYFMLGIIPACGVAFFGQCLCWPCNSLWNTARICTKALGIQQASDIEIPPKILPSQPSGDLRTEFALPVFRRRKATNEAYGMESGGPDEISWRLPQLLCFKEYPFEICERSSRGSARAEGHAWIGYRAWNSSWWRSLRMHI